MAGFSAETQQLLVRVLADTSQAQASLRQLQGAIQGLGASGETSAAASGERAGANWAKAFNKGIGKNRLVDIGQAAGVGGFKFLQNTVLATAAAGAALEIQFLRVQDAQAAMARTLEGESVPALAKLNQEILDLSKTIPVSVTELYRIGEVAGTIGIASDSIGHFTDVIAKMAATTDLGVDEAAMGIGRLLNIFGMVDEKGQAVADQADNIASAMVKLSISQASTDQEILLATERFGALATSMGLLPAQILAISSTAAALGQRPEAIGGSIQRIFQIMNQAVATGGDKLKQFGDIAGMTGKQFRDLTREDPFTAFTKFLEGFGQLTPEQQSLLFGSGRLFPSLVRGQQTLQGLAARVDLLKTAAAAAQVEYDRGKLLDEQAAIRFNTIKNNLVLLGNAITRGAVAFGSAFDEELGGAIKRVTDYITENESKFEEWGRKVADAIRSINWEQVKQFAQDFFGIFATGVAAAGKVLDALGPQVTGMLVLLKTVNALSGGALGDLAKLTAGGIGGVIKLAFDQRLARGSSPANPLFVADVAGGGAGGAGSLIGKASIAGVLATASAFALAAIVSYGIVALLRPVLTSVVPKEWLVPGGKTQGQEARERSAAMGAKPIYGPGDQYFPSGSDLAAQNTKIANMYQAAMRDDLVATQTLLDASQNINEAASKFLDSLKPSHRQGEVGKSIQTTEGRKLLNLDVMGSKFDAALADLVEHYTQQPIGTKGHSRAFVLGNLNPIENRLGRQLKQALKAGDGGRADDIVASLKKLDKVPKNDLPGWVRRLIKQAEKDNQDNKNDSRDNKKATEKVKSAVTDASDRIENLTATLRRKKLNVEVKPPQVKLNVHGGKVTVGGPVVKVTVGTRSITRYYRGTVAYGPNYVLMQSGGGGAVYSGGGGP